MKQKRHPIGIHQNRLTRTLLLGLLLVTSIVFSTMIIITLQPQEVDQITFDGNQYILTWDHRLQNLIVQPNGSHRDLVVRSCDPNGKNCTQTVVWSEVDTKTDADLVSHAQDVRFDTRGDQLYVTATIVTQRSYGLDDFSRKAEYLVAVEKPVA
jgi:Na+-transporting NADH:ubiquinone oxidoreductase subunit NqrC